MNTIRKTLQRVNIFILFTSSFLLPLIGWSDIIEGPLPEADAEGLLFITTFEPETGEYLLLQRDLGSQTERVVARGLGRFNDATVSLKGNLFFFGGNLKDETEFKIYIMERATVDDDFEIASEIPQSEKLYFTEFVYDDWREKLYVNYLVPVEGTL
jgi:hypothetical protein